MIARFFDQHEKTFHIIFRSFQKFAISIRLLRKGRMKVSASSGVELMLLFYTILGMCFEFCANMIVLN